MKPANVFLDTDKNVKLGDFGLARVLHHETSFANTYVGTPYYMSPVRIVNMYFAVLPHSKVLLIVWLHVSNVYDVFIQMYH